MKYTDKPTDSLTIDDVDAFLTEKRLSGISPETYNHYHSGIRFFYKKVLKMNWDDEDIPRMKRDRKLPTVLTKTEISALLGHHDPRSTEVYLHVSNKTLLSIKSPFDELGSE